MNTFKQLILNSKYTENFIKSRPSSLQIHETTPPLGRILKSKYYLHANLKGFAAALELVLRVRTIPTRLEEREMKEPERLLRMRFTLDDHDVLGDSLDERPRGLGGEQPDRLLRIAGHGQGVEDGVLECQRLGLLFAGEGPANVRARLLTAAQQRLLVTTTRVDVAVRGLCEDIRIEHGRIAFEVVHRRKLDEPAVIGPAIAEPYGEQLTVGSGEDLDRVRTVAFLLLSFLEHDVAVLVLAADAARPVQRTTLRTLSYAAHRRLAEVLKEGFQFIRCQRHPGLSVCATTRCFSECDLS